jgi:periplasmic protein TonB
MAFFIGSVMPAAQRLGGILISVLCHGLILLIPLSLETKAPEPYPPIEFVITLAEKPTPSEPPPAAEPPPPEQARPTPPKPKVKPKPKPKIRPRPKPVITEPVETDALLPRPEVAATPPPPAPPRRTASEGTGAPVGPQVTDFGSVTGPAFRRRVMPLYPERARRLGKEGLVVLRLTIDERGNLLNVEVEQAAGFGFAEAAVHAVKSSSFRPAMVKGQPVTAIARLPIRFILKD